MITRLDAHDGPLPGLYVCDGNVTMALGREVRVIGSSWLRRTAR